MRFARVRRSAWGRLMHDVLFACHARLDVHKYDSALRRFTVAQTGTPSDWSQLEVGVIHVLLICTLHIEEICDAQGLP